MKSISDDDLCSDCTHCTYVAAADRHACAHAFPGVTDQDEYVITCVMFVAPAGMTRAKYRGARRMLRDNGRAALKWMDALSASTMERLMDERNAKDPLAERADIISYCKREGTYCTPWHTAQLELLARFQSRREG